MFVGGQSVGLLVYLVHVHCVPVPKLHSWQCMVGMCPNEYTVKVLVAACFQWEEKKL